MEKVTKTVGGSGTCWNEYNCMECSQEEASVPCEACMEKVEVSFFCMEMPESIICDDCRKALGIKFNSKKREWRRK